MQQFTIPIGTSGNGSLSLGDGLPLFPILGTSRAGVSNTARSDTLFDGAATILFSRTKVSAYYEFFIGVLGPAVSFEFANAQVALDNPAQGGQVRVNLGGNAADGCRARRGNGGGRRPETYPAVLFAGKLVFAMEIFLENRV